VAGDIRGVKKASTRYVIDQWFAKVELGLVVLLQCTLTPESILRQP
jgi:hypothetical protein